MLGVLSVGTLALLSLFSLSLSYVSYDAHNKDTEYAAQILHANNSRKDFQNTSKNVLAAQITPTLTPTPTAIPITPTLVPVHAGELETMFAKYSELYSVNNDLLKKIARCESNLNPQSNSGVYGGLFQFSETLWRTTRQAMGSDNNPELRFNAEEAIKTAAFKISRDGTNAWINCSK